LNLVDVSSRSSLCSTSYCLAQTPSEGAEYLVYAPFGGSFTVDLSAMSSSRTLAVEWLNPSTGDTATGDSVAAGSPSQSFSPPFGGDAVLYLVDTAGHK
jgi:collagenase-like protein with putative collagen-binding domain